MFLEKKLEFWLKNNYNALLRGAHGVGKTALVKDTFERAGLKWMYFSCSTMDPWVDFIGVPKEIKEGDKSYLDLIRPKIFQNDEIEALFFDEFNRAPKKVRNAVMELIQFKSINGKKFHNLKVIWAAINPSDDENTYDVEELDPAQLDRFHVHVDIPCVPSGPYFKKQYGEDWAEAAITWWRELDSNVKKEVSPRRLDYALDMYKKGGDLKDVLPSNANVAKLLVELANGPITKKLKNLFESKNVEDSKKFLTIENHYSACIGNILGDHRYLNFFIPLISDEKIGSLISKHKAVENLLFNRFDQFESLLSQFGKVNKNIAARLVAQQKQLQQQNILKNIDKIKFDRHFNPNADENQFASISSTLEKIYPTTQDRKKQYNLLNDHLPPVLTLVQAEKCFTVLLDIITRSNKATLSQYPNIVKMLNHALAWQIHYGVYPNISAYEMKILTKQPDFILNVAKHEQSTFS